MEHLTQEQLSTLLNSPETKQLISLLQRQNPETLRRSIQAAKQGNTNAVTQILNESLSGTNAKELATTLEHRLG